MPEVTKIITDRSERIENGALQINEDWPGLFLRGDSCMALLITIEHILAGHIGPMETGQLKSLAKMIKEDVHG